MYITWKKKILLPWRCPRVPNPKPPPANHGYRNYSTHSTHSCHQEPGVSGPVCRPHHTGHVLKGSVKVTTPRLCNCGSPFLLSLIGSLVCSISHHARGFWSQFPPFLFPLQVISISPPLFTSCLINLCLIYINLFTPAFISRSPLLRVRVRVWRRSQGKREHILAKINSPRCHFTSRTCTRTVKCKLKNNVRGAALL